MTAPRHSLIDDVHDNSVNAKTRTIYVQSEGDNEDTGVDYAMASRFIKNLDLLNSFNSNEITVKMMTDGGCWNYGMAMYDAIANSTSPITCISYGFACSMSSIIPQAADKRLISKHADFMVHYGTYGHAGDAREVQSAVDHYKKSHKTMLEIYAKKCADGPFAKEHKYSEIKMYNYIERKIDKNTAWWMTAEEAVYYGFMDEVI